MALLIFPSLDHTAHGETPRSPGIMALLRKPEETPQFGAGIELAILMDVSGTANYTFV